MSDPSIETLKKQATELGLSGSDIATYVVQQQAYAREERAHERQVLKEKAEREERERERAHQLELARLAGITPAVNPVLVEGAVRPTLPVYKDGDDMGSYLIRFERVAELLKISETSYAVRLGSLLTGKAVDIYTSLPPDITADYKQLKHALLRGFCKTPAGYRQEFRSAKIRTGETYQQFSINLGRLFDQWIEGWGLGKNYDELRKFVILDQFISSLPADLRTYVKEHDVKTLDETVKLADNWASAHNSYPKSGNTLDRGKKKSDQRSSTNPTTAGEDTAIKFRGKCFLCGESGHRQNKCPKNPINFKNKQDASHAVGFCFGDTSLGHNFMASGTVNGSRVSTILRDTGCSCIIVSESVLPDLDTTQCKMVKIADYLGREDSFPQVRCFIKSPYFDGWADVVRAPIKFCSVLIGNVPGARDPNIPPTDLIRDQVHAVQTRSAKAKVTHPLVLPKLQPLSLTPTEFSKLQASCSTLSSMWDKAKSGEENFTRDGTVYKFITDKGFLYRTVVKSKHPDRIGKRSLVIPVECRSIVLGVAHESPMAGHFSHRKTLMRVSDQFFWPYMTGDVKRFCRSCDKCQRMSPKGRVKPVPLKQIPISTEPFSRVAFDIVGPLSPPTSEGHRFILTLIDYATGFPEAIPLKEIDSISVAEALLVIFSRVGIPREILSDRGAQFKSALMKELHKLLGVKPSFTTPYHPSCNGRVERFHSTLKASLGKLCSEKPREWHRYLIPIMFALREIPSDRTGYSAFELLYGRAVRGPLAVLRDLWEDQSVSEDGRSSFQYVIELKDKLAECSKIAAQNADVSSQRYRSYFDLKSQIDSSSQVTRY